MTAAMEEVREATRTVYRDHLIALMRRDPRVICVDSDTGLFSGVDFGSTMDRYVNLGIAEHTMMGVAAGMAASGWRPYVNTFAAFATTRALEALQINIAYNALPVRIMATHSGVSAGHLGPTHHALNDLAVTRTLPAMTVVVPADGPSTIALLDAVVDLPGPVYVRLGRGPTPHIPGAAAPVLGELQALRTGYDVVLVACGPRPVLAALDAADALARYGIGAGVLHAHTVKPFDRAGLLAVTERARLVVTVEEHWLAGGLGAVVTETLCDSVPRPVLRIGLPDAFVSIVGDHDEILTAYGLTAESVANRVRRTLAGPHAASADQQQRGGPNG